MSKKIIFGYWFYTVGSIIMVCGSICVSSLIIALAIIYPESYIESQLSSTIILLIMFIPGSIYLVIIAGSLLIQFAVISEKGIKIRAPFRTIRSLEWSEVKEVRYQRFYVSVRGGFTTGLFVFDDGVERKQWSALVSKKSHITVRATKCTRKIIESFWSEPIIEKEIEDATDDL